MYKTRTLARIDAYIYVFMYCAHVSHEVEHRWKTEQSHHADNHGRQDSYFQPSCYSVGQRALFRVVLRNAGHRFMPVSSYGVNVEA